MTSRTKRKLGLAALAFWTALMASFVLLLFADAAPRRSAIIGPTVSVNGSVNPAVPTSSQMTIAVANGPANRTDWVGWYAVGAPTNSGGQPADPWLYASGTKVAPAVGSASFSVKINAPAAVGLYEARLYSNDTYTLIARAPFSVGGSSCPPGQFMVSPDPFRCAPGTGGPTGPQGLTGSIGPMGPQGPSFVPAQAFGTPSSATAPCVQGSSLFDAHHVYGCVAPNTWMSVPWQAFSNQ